MLFLYLFQINGQHDDFVAITLIIIVKYSVIYEWARMYLAFFSWIECCRFRTFEMFGLSLVYDTLPWE